jgi:hypothetical protein
MTPAAFLPLASCADYSALVWESYEQVEASQRPASIVAENALSERGMIVSQFDIRLARLPATIAPSPVRVTFSNA